MGEGETLATAGQSDGSKKWHPPKWLFTVLLVLFSAGALFLLLGRGLLLFDYITSRLPLLLPLAVTLLSISTRATEIRNYEAVLKTSNDIAIGIISFDIWAFSASHSDPTGRVLVDPNTMIRGDFVLAFLIIGLFTAVGCLVLTHYNFKTTFTRHRAMLVGLITSMLVYIAPFGVLQPVPPPKAPGPTMVAVHDYTVVIPYRDPEITRYAPSILTSRPFVHFERSVSAPNAQAAAGLGVQRFLASTESDQVRGKNRSSAPEKVLVSQSDVLAVEQTK